MEDNGCKATAASMQMQIMLQDVKAMRNEEEVKMAELECRLRAMIVEVLKPTVQRTTRLQIEYDLFVTKFERVSESLKEMSESLQEVKSYSDLVMQFKGQLDQFWDTNVAFEAKLNKQEKLTSDRFEAIERQCELEKAVSARNSRNIDRAAEDMDHFNGDLRNLQSALEAGLQKGKDQMDEEIKRLDGHLRDQAELFSRFSEEVWGIEETEEISPLSLRRLDLQMKKVNTTLAVAVTDITDLSRLDREMLAMTGHQKTLESQLASVSQLSNSLTSRVDRIVDDTKKDLARTTNRMSAFTANLMREVRTSAREDQEASRRMHEDVTKTMEETQATVVDLREHSEATRKEVEAVLREIRTDVEDLEQKRRSDRSNLEEVSHQLKSRIGVASHSSEASLRGLEHLSHVLSLSLQSERMSVALDMQDFAEKRESCDGANRGVKQWQSARGRDGLRPSNDVTLEEIAQLTYQPRPVNFQGTAMERPKLIALREKLLHMAQEDLLKGPGKGKARRLPLGLSVTPESRVTPRSPTPA
eukprot:CAMPEP_0170587238 /NCGR_PEP_ID=MMETSP0224-20130122/10179_1 /TAXON_ID=285029 /ORGANISM="Togula jolla, Strain CCCM 725" /LENGTH=529 /DNA_ID=CAMNT_0010910853 /DNA_START=1 /DNA_END=1587 /DNA_ORIENTATION=-